jgi:hypothetical protein
MKIIFLFLILAFLPISASAQLCGKFGVRLNVHDAQLKPIDGVNITLSHPEKREADKGKQYLRPEHKFVAQAGSLATFTLTLSEGLQVSDPYPVGVSAPGYITLFKNLRFPHCLWITYDITLRKEGEADTETYGTIYDELGAVVKYGKITFTTKDGQKREVFTNDLGRYHIQLLPGDYTVSAEKMYYHTTRIEKLSVPAAGISRDLQMKNQKWNEDKRVIDNDLNEVVRAVPATTPDFSKP